MQRQWPLPSGPWGQLASGSWRRLVAALTLALFAVQTFAIETHVHLATAAGIATTQAQAPNHRPANPFDNPATCPLCQDLALTGHFTSPGSVVLVQPDFTRVSARLPIFSPARVSPPRPGWYGRAPPLA